MNIPVYGIIHRWKSDDDPPRAALQFYGLLYSLLVHRYFECIFRMNKSKQNRSFHFATLCTVDSQNATCDSKHRSDWCADAEQNIARKRTFERYRICSRNQSNEFSCHTDMCSKLLCGFRSESTFGTRSQFAHSRMLLWISRDFSLHCPISYVPR